MLILYNYVQVWTHELRSNQCPRLIITQFKSYLNYHAQLAIEGLKVACINTLMRDKLIKSRVGKLSYWQDQVVFMEPCVRGLIKLSLGILPSFPNKLLHVLSGKKHEGMKKRVDRLLQTLYL